MITCHLVIPKFISVHGRDPCTPDVRYPSLLFLSKPAPPLVFPAAAPTFRCLGHKSWGCLWFLTSSDTPGMICQHVLQRLLPGTYAEPHPFSPGLLSRGPGPVACLPDNLCVFISFHLFSPLRLLSTRPSVWSDPAVMDSGPLTLLPETLQGSLLSWCESPVLTVALGALPL